MSNFNIILADDHTLFRSGISALLKDLSDIVNIYEAGTGTEVISLVKAKNGNIDVVILDLKMPEMTGVEVTRILRKDYPDIKIIILSMIDKEQVIAEMFKEGINAYLLKNCNEDILKQTVVDVLNKGFCFDNKTLSIIQKNNSSSKNQVDDNIFLTKREMELLNEIFHEYSMKDIANKLNISVSTLETHKTNLLAKTKTRNTHELIIYAIKSGLLDINILLH